MPQDTPDEIIARVLERYQHKQASAFKQGMARAVLVVDENIESLASALKGANFRVKVPPKGMSDEQIKDQLLEHRILVTRNTKDFLADAPVYEYGIIGLEGLPFIDPSPDYKNNTTAKLIAQAFSEHSLHAHRGGYVLMLKPDGKHVFRTLG